MEGFWSSLPEFIDSQIWRNLPNSYLFEFVRTMSPIFSVFIAAIAAVVALCALRIGKKQLAAVVGSLRLNTMMQRRELYISLTNTLKDEDVNAMMLHIFDHFDPSVYSKEYKGYPRKIKSYLLMKRKYMYMVLASNFPYDEHDPIRVAPDLWLKELCAYREFRDVHESQGKYYLDFKKKVDSIMQKTEYEGWAVEAEAFDTRAPRRVRGECALAAIFLTKRDEQIT